jgi:sugar phosphate isomerase/epimerase
VNVQYKGYLQARGQKRQADTAKAAFDILRRTHYQGWVALEYELPEPARTKVPEMLREMRGELAA